MSFDAALTGAAAPPMANGELVFEAPWQGRAFGMASTLVDAGVLNWDEFRVALIDCIAAWECRTASGAEYAYYDRFLEALERVLLERRVLAGDTIAARAVTIEALGDGHDHDHERHHDETGH
jgi:nitrile hydratase accessory protein